MTYYTNGILNGQGVALALEVKDFLTGIFNRAASQEDVREISHIVIGEATLHESMTACKIGIAERRAARAAARSKEGA